jgi:hypothetical protein
MKAQQAALPTTVPSGQIAVGEAAAAEAEEGEGAARTEAAKTTTARRAVMTIEGGMVGGEERRAVS